MSGPLKGVRIIDCTSVILGPWATQQLGDLGADIIKVEPPEGDNSRQVGPTHSKNMAALFLGSNRNKRSVVLDLKKDAGLRALFKMCETADVFLHNLRPEPAARLGVGYEAFEKLNPRLIYLATYGYRAKGPRGSKPAYDDIIQAGSGLAHLQSTIVGEPRYIPTIIGDKTSSGTVLSAVLAALYEREKSGLGQAIEVPMFESLVAYVMAEHLYAATFLPQESAPGYIRILNKERKPFPSKDGYFALVPYTDGNWKEFCDLVGQPEILDDDRFSTLSKRIANVGVVYGKLGEICRTRTNAEWVALLRDSNIPHGPVNTLDDLLVDEQLLATGFWKEFDHPSEGRIRTPDIPQMFSRTPGSIRRLQPRLGEHSVEILTEAGLSSSEIDEMLNTGVTRKADPL
ncbi:CoA transferase [Caballeronia sp. SEWSISQ10-4 2]|uniref:CaiB/BaiF CoA transferase family protein n=1 Tax=Caballeronia sp. SEWSISQ10-4 2 TaxID=2937438 RepID=UPI0026525EB4|nr:CoA transferase [Caballeronia sp. SEWSISQ10-4 2]MDN7177092.1 CoA transferase [Caballeronia sp. SEWSISQ10-4 2]